ncbi:MAG: ATPase [Acidobacteria bacterium]|nr:MAG: ATPase [Acidobacteriota bacterium]
MYEAYFQLRERPFALSPDPDYLYPSRGHREALAYLRYGIESQAGFVVITGEIGSGKTTLLQALLRGLDGQTTVVRLMNTLLEPIELLEAITIDLGIVPSGTSKPALLRDLSMRLVEERAAGRLVLLVIDEAQNLGLPALEEIRMLSNLETEKSKLIQIVLVGQPNLRQQLDLPRLEQLRQRITVSYHLNALDADETEAYINHRLRRAALGAPLQLRREVTDRVHERARGVPRLVNVICDAALVFAYAEERRGIDPALMGEVFTELEETGVLRPITATTTVPPAAAPVPVAAAPPHPVAAASPVPVAAAPVEEVSSFAEASTEERRVDEPATDVRHVPEVLEHESLLRAREEQIARRERQLVEQQRVLAEEYRLFRARHARDLTRAAVEPHGRTPSPATSAAAWPPLNGPAHAAAPARNAPPQPANLVASWPPPETARPTFWRRVKNALLGVPIAAVEDRR